MNARAWNPRRLDVERYARDNATLEGEWPLRSLSRLNESAHPDAPPEETNGVAWQLRGEARAARGGQVECWLHLAAQARLFLVCQRCLQPVEESIASQRSFLFVHGEAQAAELDAETDDDVLAMTRTLDVQTLAEDELLLSLPLVPRHDVCPDPLVVPVDEAENAEEGADRLQPFAALAALKRGGPVN